MRSISVRIVGKFSRLRETFICPRSLTTWAEYAIYGAIDKIPQICHTYGSMWSKMDYGGVKWRTCPITCISNYIYLSNN